MSIIVCERCGGLQATVNGELIAGPPCKCGAATVPYMQMIEHDGITHPMGAPLPYCSLPNVTFTPPEGPFQIGKYTFTRHQCGHVLWLSNGSGEGMQVCEVKLEAALDKFFKENF